MTRTASNPATTASCGPSGEIFHTTTCSTHSRANTSVSVVLRTHHAVTKRARVPWRAVDPIGSQALARAHMEGVKSSCRVGYLRSVHQSHDLLNGGVGQTKPKTPTNRTNAKQGTPSKACGHLWQYRTHCIHRRTQLTNADESRVVSKHIHTSRLGECAARLASNHILEAVGRAYSCILASEDIHTV